MQIIIKFDFVVSLLHPVCMLPLECDGKQEDAEIAALAPRMLPSFCQ